MGIISNHGIKKGTFIAAKENFSEILKSLAVEILSKIFLFPLHKFSNPTVGNGVKKGLSLSPQLVTTKEQTYNNN